MTDSLWWANRFRNLDDAIAANNELRDSFYYHEAQQRMVTAHFEKWRTPEEPIPWRDRDILLRGVLGSCVSFSIAD